MNYGNKYSSGRKSDDGNRGAYCPDPFRLLSDSSYGGYGHFADFEMLQKESCSPFYSVNGAAPLLIMGLYNKIVKIHGHDQVSGCQG